MKSLELDLVEEFGTSTFSESDPEFKSLGWSGGVEDDRDWRVEDFLGIDRDSGRRLWGNPIRLNQGNEGACFPADTLVRMADGSHRPIQDVRLLDWVRTAEGNVGRVEQLMVRVASGLLRLRIKGHNHLRCTLEHPILTKRGYIAAKDLRRGDEVALTRGMFGRRNDLDTSEYLTATDYGRRTNEGMVMAGGVLTEVSAPPRRIPLSESFGRLIGLYLAEGATTPNKVTWSFAREEEDTLVAETVALIKSVLGAEARLQYRPNNCINVVLYGKLWKLLFERVFGTGSAYKCLPSTITLGPRDFLKSILYGWLDGDGHRRRSSVLGTTVSHALALDMYAIATDLGLCPTISKHKGATNRYAKTRRTRYNIEIAEGGGNVRAELSENCVWRKVTEKPEWIPFQGFVYNMHVQGDQSYVAEGVGVHNCVGFGHTGVSNAQPAKSEFGNVRGFEVYNLAKENFDPWPGSNYEGTTVRAGAKAQVYLGEYEGYAFTQDVNVLALWILNHGTAAIGVDWLTGMDRVDSEGFIHATGSVRGGHCVNVDGVTWDYEENPWGINYFRFPNSWGRSWGFNGRGRISAEDLQYLFNRGGTACMPVEIPNA